MAKEQCPGCKLPKYFRFIVKWNDNGTIGMGPNPSQRVVLVESDLLDDIYTRIEAAMGASIRHIVFEAERAAAKATIDVMIPKAAPWLIRNRLVMHPASRALQQLARIAGMADVHTVFYHVYRGSMATVRNSINLDIFAANVVGAFESAEGVCYAHKWSEFGGNLYLTIMPAKRKPDIAERLAPEVRPPLPGDRRIDVCPRCRVPVALRHLEFDTPNAIITDKRRDVRMSFIDGYAFSTVFRELVAELGDEIVPIIIEASRESAERSMKETGFLREMNGPEATYRGFLDLLPVYGQGNPMSWNSSGDSLEVAIENPYSVYLLAGQILAVYEAVGGKTGTVAFDEFAPQAVRITASPLEP